MLYSTCRRFNQPLPYSDNVVTYARGDVMPYDTFYVMHAANNTHTFLGNVTWAEEMKKHTGKQILIYLHGFNVTPKAALEGAKKLQDGLDSTKYLVVPFLWGCEDSDVNIAERYLTDRAKAEASAVGFAKFLNYWKFAIGFPKTSILCHSMGNRVFANTAKELIKLNYTGVWENFFRNVFMFAADIPWYSLEAGRTGERVPASAKNVIIAYAVDDTALQVSGLVNYVDLESDSPRLGIKGMRSWSSTPPNCIDIDCSDGNNAVDTTSGHTYFFPGWHLFKVMKKCIDNDGIYWSTAQTRGSFKVASLAAGL